MGPTITEQVLVTAALELLMCPVLAFVIKRMVGKRLDAFDGRRDEARAERAEAERRAEERREAERTIVLAMARTMLLDNYEKCASKGCYTTEEREVYHKLYEAYKSDGGNSVIDDIAPRIRKLPFRPGQRGEEEEE